MIIACVSLSAQGGFVYTLDDPYIHLALAKQIHALRYGINPMEGSALPFSNLWPLLLAIVPQPLMEFAPLI